MRTQIGLLAVSLAAGLALAGCDDEHYYCGDGTEEVNGACIGGGGECGPGTHEEDGQCVLDDDVVICGDGTTEVDGECVVITETGLPPVLESVTSPTPYPSGGLMILIGDNFMLSDSGPMVVTVDGVATTGVQVLSNNFAIADLPPSTVITVEVEISNDQGDDAADFSYTGLYGAERGCFGLGFGGGPIGGELRIIDPRTGATILVGNITSAAGTVARGVTAMAFAPDGTLWAVESICGNNEAALMTIDRQTAAATVVATLTVEAVPGPPTVFGPPPPVLTRASIPDIAFIGTTLYGYANGRSDLVTIDTTTGAVTPIDTAGGLNGGHGLAATADGELLLSNYGDELQLLQADGTSVGVRSFSSSCCANMAGLTWLDGTLYATYSGKGAAGLARYDFEAGEMVEFGTDQFSFDAIATPPELDGAPGAPPQLDPPPSSFVRPQDVAADVHQAALPTLPAFATKTTLDARGRRGVALTDLVTGDQVTIHADGEALTLTELAGYRVVENRRGELKLVDADGRRVLRGITSIE